MPIDPRSPVTRSRTRRSISSSSRLGSWRSWGTSAARSPPSASRCRGLRRRPLGNALIVAWGRRGCGRQRRSPGSARAAAPRSRRSPRHFSTAGFVACTAVRPRRARRASRARGASGRARRRRSRSQSPPKPATSTARTPSSSASASPLGWWAITAAREHPEPADRVEHHQREHRVLRAQRRRAVGEDRHRAVVRDREAGDVAGDERAGLDVPDRRSA